MSADQSPAEIRAAMHEILASTDDSDVCTFSPLVVDIWMGVDSAWVDDIFYSDGEHDAPIVELRDPEWMANFRIGALYTSGVFAQAIACGVEDSTRKDR